MKQNATNQVQLATFHTYLCKTIFENPFFPEKLYCKNKPYRCSLTFQHNLQKNMLRGIHFLLYLETKPDFSSFCFNTCFRAFFGAVATFPLIRCLKNSSPGCILPYRSQAETRKSSSRCPDVQR